MFADSILSALIAPFVGGVLGAPASLFGLLLTLRGVGVDRWCFSRLRRKTRVRPEKVLVLSLVSVGIVTLVFTTVPLTPVTMACAVALGIPAVGWIASQQTLLQNSVADEYLGRIFGAFSATTALMLFVGGLSAGALGDIVGIVPLLIISAATYCAAALLALMLLGRTHKGGREQKNNKRAGTSGPGPQNGLLLAGCPVASDEPVDREQDNRADGGDDYGPD
jgi:predicted MFS family arabinose efflux permease